MANEEKTLRQYLQASDVGSYTSAQIQLAEEIIDNYVGYQKKSVRIKFRGITTSGSTTELIDTSGDTDLNHNNNFFQRCIVQIIAGTNQGETRFIESSVESERKITVSVPFSNAIDDTSVYLIYQLAKFPRIQDEEQIVETYYKYVPEIIREAVKLQLEFISEQGDDFFNGGADLSNESIDDYSYTLREGLSGGEYARITSPKVRSLLKGIRNIKGKFR